MRFSSRRVWTSVTFDNRADAYGHFHAFMRQTGMLQRIRHLRASDSQACAGGFAPAPGSYWFWHKGVIGRFARDVKDPDRVGHQSRPQEIVTISVLFAKPDLVLDWIKAGQTTVEAKAKRGPSLRVYRTDYWQHMGEVPGRKLETVLVDDDRVDRLVQDIRWFFASEDWYRDRGVPWRRGYLLHGPPGTGKSSLIRALASELDLTLACIDIAQKDLGDDGLREALTTTPKKSLIAIEDAVFVGRDTGKEKANSGVSFSGLLNAIDGVAAQEGRALIMTTNHRDQLDPALIRPGRADRHVELSHVSAHTAKSLFNRFFPEAGELAEAFASNLGETQINPAALQAWLLENAEDAAVAATAKGLLGPKLVAAEAA